MRSAPQPRRRGEHDSSPGGEYMVSARGCAAIALLVLLGLALLISPTPPVRGQAPPFAPPRGSLAPPQVTEAVRHDVSPPLRSLGVGRRAPDAGEPVRDMPRPRRPVSQGSPFRAPLVSSDSALQAAAA